MTPKSFTLIVEGDYDKAGNQLACKVVKEIHWPGESVPLIVVLEDGRTCMKVAKHLSPGDRYHYHVIEPHEICDLRKGAS